MLIFKAQQFSYVDDVVLDPFMGSGSTAVAARRTSRRYVGFDTDPTYVSLARDRIAQEAGRDADSGDGDEDRARTQTS